MPRRQTITGILPFLLLQLLCGCGGTWRTSSAIRQDVEDKGGWAKVRVTLSNSQVMVIRKTSIENELLIGEREREPDATAEAYGYYHPQTKRVEIPLAEIETLEIYEDDAGVSTVLVGGVAAMIVVIAVLSPVSDAY